MRYVCVGADTIRPVVSPEGKQRRRKAPTMHHRTFYDEIRRYHESNMVYWQHCCIGWCVTVLLKNLQRWRAANSRPYADCATELPARKFRCAVGAAISRPVVSPKGKQRRRKAPTMQCQTFANAIRWCIVETWYICNIKGLVGV